MRFLSLSLSLRFLFQSRFVTQHHFPPQKCFFFLTREHGGVSRGSNSVAFLFSAPHHTWARERETELGRTHLVDINLAQAHSSGREEHILLFDSFRRIPGQSWGWVLGGGRDLERRPLLFHALPVLLIWWGSLPRLLGRPKTKFWGAHWGLMHQMDRIYLHV